MLAEPLLDKFCIVFCVSFIVEHRVAIWEEKACTGNVHSRGGDKKEWKGRKEEGRGQKGKEVSPCLSL